MSTLKTPFRYDFVGSFLRPQKLKDAKADFAAGKITQDELEKITDDCVSDIVVKQKAAGFHAITDGEFRRKFWHLDFMWGFEGVAHEKKGCADRVMPYLWEDGRFLHTLIVSAPGCGKTTMLRDIIRQISDGESPYPGLTVGVVDERSEIAGCYLGVAQNDVGIRTDVLDCCPKAEGMMMLIRAMSPDVVAVDEIGTGEDIRAIESVVNCGCKLLATVHGNSMEDMKQKPLLNRLVESHVFERYIVLDAKPRAGSVQAIFDGRGTTLYRREAFL